PQVPRVDVSGSRPRRVRVAARSSLGARGPKSRGQQAAHQSRPERPAQPDLPDGSATGGDPMKRVLAFLAALTVVVAAVAFAKGEDKSGHSTAGAKSASWTGEILDAGCYIAHGASGPKHAECALKCASNGMPLMLMTKDGKAILLTPNHDNPDAYNQLKTMAGSQAKVTGTLAGRGGGEGVAVTAGGAGAAAAPESADPRVRARGARPHGRLPRALRALRREKDPRAAGRAARGRAARHGMGAPPEPAPGGARAAY